MFVRKLAEQLKAKCVWFVLLVPLALYLALYLGFALIDCFIPDQQKSIRGKLPFDIKASYDWPTFESMPDEGQKGPVNVVTYITTDYVAEFESVGQDLLAVRVCHLDGSPIGPDDARSLLLVLTGRVFWEPEEAGTRVPVSAYGYIVVLNSSMLLIHRENYRSTLISNPPRVGQFIETVLDSTEPNPN